MRFSAPRSLSPSPVRGIDSSHGRSTFRAPSNDSDSEQSSDEEASDYDTGPPSSSGSGSLSSGSESESGEFDGPIAKPVLRHRKIQEDEGREIDATVAAIRVRTRHKDPYDEWERQTRKDAFHSARNQQASIRLTFRERQEKAHALAQQRLKDVRSKEMEEVQRRFASMDVQWQQYEQRLKDIGKESNRKLWERIETAIKVEEDKVRARLDAERKMKEELDRLRKAEEERRRLNEEKKRKEEEERKRKLLEEQLEKEKEEKERAEKEELERKKKEQDKGADTLRTNAGLPRADDLWLVGLRTLKRLKNETMRAVKGPKPPDPLPDNYSAPPPPPLKKLWSAQRRKITPKVGQLTNDAREIMRITEDLKMVVAPVQGTPEALHHALLSSLSKIIIRQAETEVTAHKEQAAPLAQLSVNLISHYPLLADIFWAKLCELAGCWIAPVAASERDVVDGAHLGQKQYSKLWSRRPEELQDAQTMRITGVLRLYFHMLFVPVLKPLPLVYRPARFWAYISTLLSSPELLGRAVAAEAIYVALDVGGLHAKHIWGKQWIKVLAHIYEGVQGEGKERLGGSDVGAQASRARCQYEIEKIMAEP